MTKEEFENLTVKEMAEVCDKSDCFECPFGGEMYMCLFNNTPCEWIKEYIRKEEGH